MLKQTPLSRRVVVTGIGVVSCAGIGKDAFWRAARDGISGIRRIDTFDVSDLPSQIAGIVRGFDPLDYIPAKKAAKMGRFTHFALAAARLAMEDAALDLSTFDRSAIGCAFGSTTASYGNLAEEVYLTVYRDGLRAVDASAINEAPTHAAASHVAIELGLQGPCISDATGCATGILTTARGFEVMRSGRARCMIVGASEACLSEFIFGLLCRQRVLSTTNDEPHKSCKPFDKYRDGLVAAEGGGAFVLETAKGAMERGARIYAEVIGWGVASEGYHMVVTQTDGAALARALRSALESARISAADVDYVCPHGIGNRQYDTADACGLRAGLGDHIHRVAVSSIKGVTGQPFAAGGTFQTASVCMTMATDTIAPTINHTTPDDDCVFDVVPNRARRARVDTAIVNGHSFGGTHAVMALRRFEP